MYFRKGSLLHRFPSSHTLMTYTIRRPRTTHITNLPTTTIQPIHQPHLLLKSVISSSFSSLTLCSALDVLESSLMLLLIVNSLFLGWWCEATDRRLQLQKIQQTVTKSRESDRRRVVDNLIDFTTKEAINFSLDIISHSQVVNKKDNYDKLVYTFSVPTPSPPPYEDKDDNRCCLLATTSRRYQHHRRISLVSLHRLSSHRCPAFFVDLFSH